MPTNATLNDIATILASRKGACPTTIMSETIPELVGGKKCSLLAAGPVKKVSVVNGIANFLYERAVNRVREKEVQPLTSTGAVEIFNAEPRRWGCRLVIGQNLLPFIHHKKGLVQPSFRDIVSLSNLPSPDELYLELQCRAVGMVKYIQNDKELDSEFVKQFLREKTEGARQQVDNPVILRDFKLSNIRSITLDGKVYDLQQVS